MSEKFAPGDRVAYDTRNGPKKGTVKQRPRNWVRRALIAVQFDDERGVQGLMPWVLRHLDPVERLSELARDAPPACPRHRASARETRTVIEPEPTPRKSKSTAGWGTSRDGLPSFKPGDRVACSITGQVGVFEGKSAGMARVRFDHGRVGSRPLEHLHRVLPGVTPVKLGARVRARADFGIDCGEVVAIPEGAEGVVACLANDGLAAWVNFDGRKTSMFVPAEILVEIEESKP